MITQDPFFYLPNLYTFQNGNSFYGSLRGLRFYVEALDNQKELLPETDCPKVFRCRVWLGEYCLEESEVLSSACFPLNESGYEQVLRWLDEQYQKNKAEKGV